MTFWEWAVTAYPRAVAYVLGTGLAALVAALVEAAQ